MDSKNTHGTGCTLSSAIAAGLARGMPLVESIALAKKFVSEAIKASNEIKVGEGRGPVHHFHAFWKKRGG
jgi:hydroxymethylpyrimidine/phosphomethylpyrimidine kinase